MINLVKKKLEFDDELKKKIDSTNLSNKLEIND